MIPKFRVFVKSGTKQMYGGVYEEDAMVPVGVLDITGEEVTVWGCGRENCGMCDDYFRVKDIILMQSTGLEDKNGVDVFEGDYLSWVSFESHKEFKGEVVFSKGSFCMVVKLKGRDYKVPLYELSDSDSLIEVLGNVYENPELLEAQND